MRRVVRRVELRPLHLLALLTALVAAAGADVIFQVPEVLVRHAAVPRPVGTGGTGGKGGKGGTGGTGGTGAPAPRNESDPWPEGDSLQTRYEYFVEHAISTGDAKKMAIMLKLSDMPQSIPGCGKCTKRELEYCETKVVADHCCCERHFLPEPFPWLPHTCYIGPERCTPLARNCAHYARLRDCCCLRKLAEHWKGILSRSARMSVSGITLLLLSAVLFTIYL